MVRIEQMRLWVTLVAWLITVILLPIPLYAQSILTRTSLGTGFIVSPDGYIITNKHVIEGATDITVRFSGKEYIARLVDALPDNDIALLKIDAQGLPAVMLGNSDGVQIGDTVYAIGCPAGVCGTVTEGRVANLGISSKTEEGTILHDLIMTDLTTTHGSSGGPLLNDRGEVIGITTALIVAQGETTGFGVSIPINQAVPLLQKVPGFSRSKMGQATRVLSLREIRASVGPCTVFVQAQVQRALRDLLPHDVLGMALTILHSPEISDLLSRGQPERKNSLVESEYTQFLYGIDELTWSINRYLYRRVGVSTKRWAVATNKTEGDHIREQIYLAVFEYNNSREASVALNLFGDFASWDYVEITRCSGLFPECDARKEALYKTWFTHDLVDAKTAFSRREAIGNLTVQHRVCWYGDFGYADIFNAVCPYKIVPFFHIWSFQSFELDNLVFLCVYHVQVWSRNEYPACEWSFLGKAWLQLPRACALSGTALYCSLGGETVFQLNLEPFIKNGDAIFTAMLENLTR